MITAESRLDSVGSTMDAARELAAGQDFLLVSAREQTRGKGTKGRTWLGAPGNLYMTVGVHRRHLPPARLALFPLELGLHVWEEAAARVVPQARGSLTLKWPNDLLLDGRKAAGILVESFGDYLMAGIGVNLGAAPPVADGGTTSACLADAGIAPEKREAMVDGIYARIRAGAGDPETLLLRWQARVDWNRAHRLRDRPGKPFVLPVSVNAHGHLLVRDGEGREEWLVSDYLV